MLQDTHFTHKEENNIRTQWGFERYFSNFASNTRGVAVFLNNNFECNVHNEERDDKGNMLILETEIEGKMVTLINIYGPNRDDPEFYRTILKTINEKENLIIITGDFNLVFNPDEDLVNYVNVNNLKAREEVLNIMIEVNLFDVWRELNLEKTAIYMEKKSHAPTGKIRFFFNFRVFIYKCWRVKNFTRL